MHQICDGVGSRHAEADMPRREGLNLSPRVLRSPHFAGDGEEVRFLTHGGNSFFYSLNIRWSIPWMDVCPQKPIDKSSSLRMISRAQDTPASPMAPKP